MSYPCCDAVTVGDDQRWTIIGFGFEEGLEGLLVVEAHGDACHVDVAISHGDQAKVLLGQAFAAHGKFGNCRARRGLAGLSAGVGIDFGVEHQHVDVAAGSQHVIETAVADIVGPAVAAHDPHGFLDQAVGHADQVLGARILGAR